ncbi:MAG TPA: hypothetical protein ENK08_04390 [Chloroflexi bacterium]|nr:hypothetical protein [Chloroflexota bacterium]
MRRGRRFRLFTAIFLALLLASPSLPSLARRPTQGEDAAARLLARMPPAARVGQLFVVTFPGTEIEEGTDIYQLIVEERIGGVLLTPENGNIVNQGNTPLQVATLTNGLQRLAWEASQKPIDLGPSEEGGATLSPFVPLFIAIKGGGIEDPYTDPISGTTPLPPPMALGATWDPANAQTVGAILGQELNRLGINLLLGPSLDVLNTPRPGTPADLGVRSFGGDPYWVSQMGKAYIQGVHEGSTGRVAVIPGHFPGLGAADRPLTEEVSTVQKSLEQLKQIELAPFFAATGAEEPLAQPDGLLVSHIRYRGFQGNIYASTKPVSFDPQALQQLMALPELAPWREAGGLTVADELGVRAVRRFYDPTEQSFNGLRVARDAFVAGNDLLILSHFASTDDWETHFENVRTTIAFFREKYATDPTFQAWVDQAVLRILRLKLRLYGDPFTLSDVQVDLEALPEEVGQQAEQLAAIAQAAVTLLSPLSPDLRPPPPAADEQIVIFTDDRQVALCAGCPPTYVIPPTLLEETLVRLYGPQATDQVSPGRVLSFTFSDLLDYLSAPTPPTEESATPTPPHPVEAALEQADWVLFAMLDVTDQVPTSTAVRRFLAEQADLLKDKRVVVFAFGAPYYLDTTEIAKLSAYFGLYGHTPPFVEAAARALFDEFPFTGASPVSIASLNYDLIVQTQPDPDQEIHIYYQVGEEPVESTEGTPQPPEIFQGDTLRLRTSVILDRNGHPVPDGTPVEFIFTYPQEGLEHTVQVTTQDGVAETAITLDRVGQLQISVRAEPHPRTVGLEMEIREGEPAVIVTVPPTPTQIPPTPTPTVSPSIEATPTPESATPQPGGTTAAGGTGPGGRDLALGLGSALLVAFVGYLSSWAVRRDPVGSLRVGLWSIAGGLMGYIGLATDLPWAAWTRQHAGGWSAALAALLGAVPLMVLSLIAVSLGGSRIDTTEVQRTQRDL